MTPEPACIYWIRIHVRAGVARRAGGIMTFLLLVIYIFVGLGVFLEARRLDVGPVQSVWNAVVWPFGLMVLFGRTIF